MIDNALFLIVMILVPWLCYKANKIDNENKKVEQNQKIKPKREGKE